MLSRYLKHYFDFPQHKTNLKIEIVAGLTTFLTMAYIIVVNPMILGAAGIDVGAAFVATCLAAAFGCLAMGLLANYPVALAPTMGLNAYFAYSVVQGLGYPWQIALGAVFVSGIAFLLLTVFGIRQWLVYILPPALKIGIAAGIGLFLGAIALQNVGLVIFEPKMALHLSALTSHATWLALVGIALIIILDRYKVLGSILIGILAVTVIGIALKITKFQGIIALPPSIMPTLLALHMPIFTDAKLMEVIFTFFFVALFDSTGTLIGILQQAKLMKPNGNVPRLTQALFADSAATVVGSLLGTSTTGSYIESSAGVRAGGRTGMTTIIVGLLFLLALFFSPLAKTIPAYATAPALIYVAFLMARNLKLINWRDISESLPALVTTLTIPLTFSIANGIAYGLISYVILQLVTGKIRKVHVTLIILAAVFVGYLFLQR